MTPVNAYDTARTMIGALRNVKGTSKDVKLEFETESLEKFYEVMDLINHEKDMPLFDYRSSYNAGATVHKVSIIVKGTDSGPEQNPPMVKHLWKGLTIQHQALLQIDSSVRNEGIDTCGAADYIVQSRGVIEEAREQLINSRLCTRAELNEIYPEPIKEAE